MRVSQEEKEKTRCKLIEAAVEVISHQGFRNATMREIAERAGVGDATIYKYFPTKESFLIAFFALRIEDLIQRLSTIEDFHTYQFREQLHVLIETLLELFSPDRPFIRIAYQNVFLSNWISTGAEAKASRDRFFEIVDDLFTSSVEAGEFDDLPFKNLFYQILWDYTLGITYYWLEDDSPAYMNTTQMLDKSLAVLDALLKSPILSRMTDLVHFLIREHLLSKIGMQNKAHTPNPSRPKRKFMADDEVPASQAKAQRTKKAAKKTSKKPSKRG